MRMHFDELFSIQNGAIVPKFPISIGGVTITPGVSFGYGVFFGGVEIAQHSKSYFDVDLNNGMHLINGIYK